MDCPVNRQELRHMPDAPVDEPAIDNNLHFSIFQICARVLSGNRYRLPMQINNVE